MAYTLEQVTLLEEAIATGARSIYYGGKRIEYQDTSEMMKILRVMKMSLGLIPKTPTRRFAEHTKGLE